MNGKEKDDEIKGECNSIDFEARIYDTRLGRTLSQDPHQRKYPFMSPYSMFYDNPNIYIDEDGKDVILIIWATTKDKIGHAAIAVTNYKEVVEVIDGKKTTRLVEDGYKFFDLWPKEGVGADNATENVKSEYRNSYTFPDERQAVYYDISFKEGYAPDGVYKIETSQKTDLEVTKVLNDIAAKKADYNGCQNNCSDYASEAIEKTLFGNGNNEIGKEKIGETSITTPNKLYTDTKNIAEKAKWKTTELKKPTTDMKKSFIDLKTEGSKLKRKYAEEKIN